VRARLSVLVLVLAASGARATPVRLKELAEVAGVRDNDLLGYGLVVGLNGTGDTERILFTQQSLSGMLGRLGIRVDPREVRARNVAAVMVTTRLPTFARAGSRLDVVVSSLGNARSLAGGTLLLTPLTAPDGAVYAVAQGPVQTGGYEVSAAGSFTAKNQPNSGRVPRAAVVEKAVVPDLGNGPLLLSLKAPDFTTASRVAIALDTALGKGTARALDPVSIEVKIPDAFKDDKVGLLSKIELVEVDADRRARIAVSERTGTVVAGEGVRLRPVAVAHGGLRVSVTTETLVSQPAPFARVGRTVSSPFATIGAEEDSRKAVALPGTASVEDLAKALNLLGATPRDLIAILQAMKAAGAFDADLEVL